MYSGYLLVDKPQGITSFGVIHRLRRRLNVQKIGHGGTLDPFATGLLIIFVGRSYTKQAMHFLTGTKEYEAVIQIGVETDTFDCDGKVLHTSDKVPTIEEIQAALAEFQGTIQQIPPMFSAKKIRGKRLYELAREGRTIAREPVTIEVTCTLLDYQYPELKLHIRCSKGTYIRSIASDLGRALGSYAYVKALRRVAADPFRIEESVPLDVLLDSNSDINRYMRCDLAHAIV